MHRTRLAPSPTGKTHLGHARTYLVAWLRARQAGDAVVMRIEDLDVPRVVPGAADAILADLRWLGLDWDEGPDVGGDHGPYVQTERTERYRAALDDLRNKDLVYSCTCSRKDILALASAPHGDDGPIYPGTCRQGPKRSSHPAAIRFRMPDPSPAFADQIAGWIAAGKVRGDFVLHRSDGIFAYQLACVVDDRDMCIGEVIRGADLIASTPRQIALHEALDSVPPTFAHIPLVLGRDGERLAKRHGSIAIDDYRSCGISAERIVGLLGTSLGLVPIGWQGMPSELISVFDYSKLPKSAVELAAPESLRMG